MSLQEEHARRARTADIPQLHEQVVSSVLQHVALRHRLASSSLTCKSWRSAANAATKEELENQAFEAHGVRPDFLQSMGQLRFLKIEAGASPDALLLLCDALSLLGELRGVTFRLKMLSIPGLVTPGVDMTPLLSLQQLQYLFVGGEVVDDAVAGSVLAKMTQLMRLKVFGAPQLTGQGMLALTSLKKLIELEIGGCGFSITLSNEDQEGYVSLHHDEDGPPDVWMQLLARCLRSDVCLKEATAQLLAYHAEVEKKLKLAYAHMRADAEHYASVCGSDD
ncbi:hypothetical protein OEZ86_004427 [Tetradesmus obliquus]|nr:hypothetical protein OEZ86_004427 [Tetradesmus obliquus]